MEFELSDVEVETLRRAAAHRGLEFDASRRRYTAEELNKYGLVREGYTRAELLHAGVAPQKVSSHDVLAQKAPELFPLDTPYGSGIQKWQLPFDMMPMRVAKTVFAPGSEVSSHTHPEDTLADPGGCLRMIAKGKVIYEGFEYGPGDWFFVPNGTAYNFTTDPEVQTELFYTYRFFGAVEGNRFSHPHA